MTAQASPELNRVVVSVEGRDPAYRESIDTAALLSLKGEERTQAEDLLIAHLAGQDWRIPPALAEMKSRRAKKPLRRRLTAAKGQMRLAVSRALVDLGELKSMDQAVVDVLDEGEYAGSMAALSEAEELDSEIVKEALLSATMEHPEPEVRGSAAATLLYMDGVAEDPLAWDHRDLTQRFGEGDEKARKEAYNELLELLGREPDEVA